MKKAKKLGISVLLISVLVTGCGGGSNGITNTMDDTVPNQAAQATPIPQGGVIQSSINNTSGLGVDSTSSILDFKRVAGGQDIAVNTHIDINSEFDGDGMSTYPHGVPKDSGTTAFEYKKTLADGGDFEVVGAVADYDTDASDYLSFGLWNYEAIDGTVSEVGAYADGGDPFTQANIAGLTGTAEYKQEDGALGAYIYNNGDDDVVVLGDVALTADFDTDTISGNIDNIRSIDIDDAAHQEPIFEGLNVALEEANIDTAQEGGFWTGDTLITNTENSERYKGKWGGQFYGNGATAAHPEMVSGTFGGAGATGSFVGAFIAEKQ